MKKTLLLLVIFLVLLNFATAAQQEVFILNLKYDKGDISSERFFVTEGYFNEPVNQLETGYTLEVISFDDETLYSQKFDFQLEISLSPLRDWFDENGNQIHFPTEEETVMTLDTAIIELIFPYFKNAKEINIYNQDNAIALTISTVYLADVCNDGECQAHENHQTCPQDCLSGGSDGFCDRIVDGKCDSDCATETDSDCATQGFVLDEFTIALIGGGLALIVVFLIVIVYLWMQTGKKSVVSE